MRRHPQARRVGGPDWTQRRLLEALRERDPDFVLLRQTRRELEQECCDAEAAREFLGPAAQRPLRLRWLAILSGRLRASLAEHAGLVAGLWAGDAESEHARHRLIPDGELWLMFNLGPPQRVVQLDEERKATMVSNLLVVLCSDRDAQPVVNTGTLYQ